MMKTIEAVLETDGRLHLKEKIDLTHSQRVLVTFLDEPTLQEVSEAALLSEEALAQDWNRPEETAAWQHLQ